MHCLMKMNAMAMGCVVGTRNVALMDVQKNVNSHLQVRAYTVLCECKNPKNYEKSYVS